MEKLLYRISAGVLLIAILWSCTQESPTLPANIELSSTQGSVVEANPSGDSFSIRFTSSADWNVRLSEAVDWVVCSPLEGKSGAGNVKVQTTMNESGALRTVDVEIYSGDVSVPVTIKQDKFVPTFEMDRTSDEISAKGGEITIVINTDIDYDYEIVPDWIKPLESKVPRKYRHTFVVEPNDLPEERTGVISFCSNSTCHAFSLTQRAAGTEADDWKHDEFEHRSLALRFTADWCPYCPYMATAFTSAKNSLDGKLEIVSLHGGDSSYEFSGTDVLAREFGVTSYPTGIIDKRASIPNYSAPSTTASVATQVVQETLDNYPVVTGIECNSTIGEDAADIDTKLYFKKAGDYKVTVLLLEDKIIGYQANASSDYEHNDIARLAVTSISGEDISVAEDYSIVEKSYSAELDPAWNAENMRVLIYIERKYGDQERVCDVSGANYIRNKPTSVDNALSVKFGEYAPLKLN